jgi:dipeptidase
MNDRHRRREDSDLSTAQSLPISPETISNVQRVPDSSPSVDPGIPMLTDVLQLPRRPDATLHATPDAVDWSTLAQQVQDKVMERVLRRVQQTMKEQVRSALRNVVERSVEGLAGQLQDTLAEMARDLVERAISDEMQRWHAEIAAGSVPPSMKSALSSDTDTTDRDDGIDDQNDDITALRPLGPLGPLR